MLGMHFATLSELIQVPPPAISSVFFFFFSASSLWVGGVPLAAFSPPFASCFWVVGLGVSLAVLLHLASLLRVG